MDECGIDERKGRRVWTVAHWFLIALGVLFAAGFVAVLQGMSKTIDRYGIPSGNEVDWLLSIVAIIGVLALIDGVIRRIRSGIPPFEEDNARSFLLMAVVVAAKIVLSTAVQATIFFSETALDKSFSFSIDALIAAVVLLAIYKIFKYGSTLQAEVQDLV